MNVKHLTIGILAHVDAGKTTLSESILFHTGSIRSKGRVDHKDAFLDTFQLEKDRGITIYSKQATFKLNDYQVTLLDTPGHVDFSSEMERTLSVLDYGILLINGADGVQSHTLTLWRLSEQHQIPVFIFVNKMDQIGTDREALLEDIQRHLGDGCIPFDEDASMDESLEAVAMTDEKLLDYFLETGHLKSSQMVKSIRRRQVYPVYFGSALKETGVQKLLTDMTDYMEPPLVNDSFGGRVFKITRDEQGNRLTHVKMTGGSMKVKDLIGKEKIDQIRLYSGKQYVMEQEVAQGVVCALTGLKKTYAGQGFGFEVDLTEPTLIPVLKYQMILPDGAQVNQVLEQLKAIEEEEPHLNVEWNESLGEIHVHVMGQIELEILKSMIRDRYNLVVSFDDGNLVYKETIREAVLGGGHFEPLRHYAEVWLLMRPGEKGSGITVNSGLSVDDLPRQYQRLIMSHVLEKEHVGTLTGSPITDIRITVVGGAFHKKHTEGGDFREATYRAIRQGLRQTEMILLEPVYRFRLEMPLENMGRAMADILQMSGRHEEPIIHGERVSIEGIAPVSTMMNYGQEVISYTKGLGKLTMSVDGYEPCHNAEEIVEQLAYDVELDSSNPCGSVFCSKGTGFNVPWERVHDFMHSGVSSAVQYAEETEEIPKLITAERVQGISEDEISQIMEKTYGPLKRKQSSEAQILTGKNRGESKNAGKGYQDESYSGRKAIIKSAAKIHQKDKFLLVDGYNIIFSWDSLKDLAIRNMDGARQQLLEILSDYRSQIREEIIVVFDAYRVEGGTGSAYNHGNIHVVYTKEAETADQYIERFVTSLRPTYDVTVATSDRVEQVIIMGKGATKLSAENFYKEVKATQDNIREKLSMKEDGVSQRIPLDFELFQ